jgi:hypothetical protein
MTTVTTDPSITTSNHDPAPSPRSAALIAGISYIALFILGIFGNFFVRESLVDSNDAAATFANIQDAEALFRAGLVSFLIIFILDVVVAWALYIVFKAVNRHLSLAAAWFRVVYTVFLGVALIFMFLVLMLVSGAEFLNAFDQGQREAQVALALEAFNYTWLIGLASFGIHLIILGYLLVVSHWTPKALGIIMAIAGTAYVVDTLAYSLLPNYTDYANVFLVLVAVPSVIGEFSFAVWLLKKGGKAQSATGHSPTMEPTTPKNR